MVSTSLPGQLLLSLPLLRVKPGRECDIQLVSDEVLWVQTHWVGRQVLCGGPKCPICSGGGGRTHGYFVALVRHGSGGPASVLVEMTPSPWSRMTDLARMMTFSISSGLTITASRRRSNSPLRLEPTGNASLPGDCETSVCRTLDALAVLYGLPVSTTDETLSDWTARVRSRVLRLAADAAV